MTHEEIKNKVTAIVADKIGFPVSEISESTRFKADLGTDSLDAIELLMEFERVFGIKIPDEEMFSVVTVGDVINDLAAKFGVVAEEKENPKENEHEKRVAELKTFIAKCNGFNKENRQKAFDMIDALRPQPYWKPSDEQMEALSDACVEASTFKKGKILESLYNDLEKLQK